MCVVRKKKVHFWKVYVSVFSYILFIGLIRIYIFSKKSNNTINLLITSCSELFKIYLVLTDFYKVFIQQATRHEREKEKRTLNTGGFNVVVDRGKQWWIVFSGTWIITNITNMVITSKPSASSHAALTIFTL